MLRKSQFSDSRNTGHLQQHKRYPFGRRCDSGRHQTKTTTNYGASAALGFYPTSHNGRLRPRSRVLTTAEERTQTGLSSPQPSPCCQQTCDTSLDDETLYVLHAQAAPSAARAYLLQSHPSPTTPTEHGLAGRSGACADARPRPRPPVPSSSLRTRTRNLRSRPRARRSLQGCQG